MENPLKCIVVDDEPLARELICGYVAATPALELYGEFESAQEALALLCGGGVDLAILDINMPVLNGIDLAAMIPENTRIIYITAYDRYALQGYRVNALDYLLKPVSYAEFASAVKKAVEWTRMRRVAQGVLKETGRSMINVRADYRLVRMKTDSILYAEAQGDRVVFHRTEGDPVSSLMSMREAEELLPEAEFMRVHRSFIVNISKVEIIERNRIVFGRVYIPISDSRKEEFLSRLAN